MYKKIILTILLSLIIPNVYASVLGDCADETDDNGDYKNSSCVDDTRTATSYDPAEDEEDQCIDACNAQAGSITNFMNANHANGGKWVCTATASSSNGVVTDPHGNKRLLCSCTIKCNKGIVKKAVLIDPIPF
jgi:hypothetical protein